MKKEEKAVLSARASRREKQAARGTTLPLRNAHIGQRHGWFGAFDTCLEASTVAKAKPFGWLRAVSQIEQQRRAGFMRAFEPGIANRKPSMRNGTSA